MPVYRLRTDCHRRRGRGFGKNLDGERQKTDCGIILIRRTMSSNAKYCRHKVDHYFILVVVREGVGCSGTCRMLWTGINHTQLSYGSSTKKISNWWRQLSNLNYVDTHLLSRLSDLVQPCESTGTTKEAVPFSSSSGTSTYCYGSGH